MIGADMQFDACVDALADVLHLRLSGTTADRWQALLEHVAVLRDHPPLVVHGDDGDAVKRRTAALKAAVTLTDFKLSDNIAYEPVLALAEKLDAWLEGTPARMPTGG